MDFSGVHIPTTMTASATFASVYWAFQHFDKLQSRNNRRFVSRWLLGLTVEEREWVTFFQELFSRLFGERHLSLKCVLRSLLFTLLITALLALLTIKLIIIAIDNNLDALDVALIWPSFFIISAPLDYLSLWKTRYLLSLSLVRTTAGRVLIVLVDFLSTSVFYILGTSLIMGILELLTNEQIGFWDYLEQTVYNFIVIRRGSTEWMMCVPAFLTSAWVWTYIMISSIMRIFAFLPKSLHVLSKVADLNEHPVKVIGFVTAGLASIIVFVLGLLTG